MKLFSANIEDLRSLYISKLKKALDMERKIVDALPDMIAASTDEELGAGLRTHLEESRMHVSLVESLLNSNAGEAEAETCKVINGLTTEASDTIKDVTEPSVRDIAIIGAAQQVEHHEIAVYGTLRRWAEILNLTEDAQVIKTIEAEEFKADALLSKVAGKVNVMAMA